MATGALSRYVKDAVFLHGATRILLIQAFPRTLSSPRELRIQLGYIFNVSLDVLLTDPEFGERTIRITFRAVGDAYRAANRWRKTTDPIWRGVKIFFGNDGKIPDLSGGDAPRDDDGHDGPGGMPPPPPPDSSDDDGDDENEGIFGDGGPSGTDNNGGGDNGGDGAGAFNFTPQDMVPGARSVLDYNARRARGMAINDAHRPLPRFDGKGPACGVRTMPTLAESSFDAPMATSSGQYSASVYSRTTNGGPVVPAALLILQPCPPKMAQRALESAMSTPSRLCTVCTLLPKSITTSTALRPTTMATRSPTLTTPAWPTSQPTRPPSRMPTMPSALSAMSLSAVVAPCLMSSLVRWPEASGPTECRLCRQQTSTRLLFLDQQPCASWLWYTWSSNGLEIGQSREGTMLPVLALTLKAPLARHSYRLADLRFDFLLFHFTTASRFAPSTLRQLAHSTCAYQKRLGPFAPFLQQRSFRSMAHDGSTSSRYAATSNLLPLPMVCLSVRQPASSAFMRAFCFSSLLRSRARHQLAAHRKSLLPGYFVAAFSPLSLILLLLYLPWHTVATASSFSLKKPPVVDPLV
ncbi:uncharacterized protein J3D65DRAFT_614411 [Phyllosticta citribraziliensis]|uniref:Uncharacterized protein n=1 Tax=Phyllosticta citribraziliensis TaxID=989973 RepID=A0ABR1M657_9PEZI